jgi:hypothetical protein
MSNAITTYGAPSYQLIEFVGGCQYVLTGFGEFKSGMEACDFAQRQPRNNVWHVREARDCVRFGIVIGTSHKIVATVQP